MVLRTGFILGFVLLLSSAAIADAPPGTEVETSPKAPWGEFTLKEGKSEYPLWARIALWIPNRLLDAVDMVKFDVGVGTSRGGVARVTEGGQAGWRKVPGSLRMGLRGRDIPVFYETSDEKGAGGSFTQSEQREVCPGEIGVGLDLFAGLYAGVCVDEVFDFASGIFFFDPKDDDIK